MPPCRASWRGKLLLAGAGLLAAGPAGAAASAADPDAVLATANSAAAQDLYLDLYINGQPTQSLYSFREAGGQLYISRADLIEIGVSPAALRDIAPQPGAAGARHEKNGQPLVASAGALIGLDQVPGLHYRYDRQKQTVDLILSDGIRTANTVGGARRTAGPAQTATGLVLNYDAYAQTNTEQGSTTSLGVWSEQRLFSGWGILDNTGTNNIRSGSQGYIRLDTAWHYDFADRLTTLQAGDAISSSLNWSRSVRLGGMQLRSNFNLRPDLITFPVPQFSGSAAVPSTVDLYVNSVRQISADVPSGPFVINSVPGVNGAGLATLVVRDPLGRAVSTSLPVYVDSRMLAGGLQSYGVEGGVLRYNYGSSSFGYGGSAALNGVYRYGLNDWLTLESHGEGSAGVLNAGAGGLLRLGQWGVLNGSFSGSGGAGQSGVQAGLGYQLVLPRLSLALQSTRAYAGYRDLASIGATPPPRASDQASLSMPVGRTQTFGLSYIHLNQPAAGASSIGSLSYTLQLPHSLSLLLSAFQDFDQQHSRGAWLGLSFYLGHQTSGFATGGVNNGSSTFSANVNHNADYDGGWEWAAQAAHNAGSSSEMARAGYLGRYGEVLAAVQHAPQQDVVSLEADGGLVLMDGALEASRRIYDSFALVSTDGIGGVPVLHENRLLGNTDAGGHLLVPDLNSYQQNHLAIDDLALPADARVPANHMDLVPRSQSGVLAHFAIERYVAASLILHDRSGRELPLGTALTLAETGARFVVGYDGMAFVEDLKEHNHLQAQGPDGLSCTVSFDYHPAGTRGELPTLGPLTCLASGETAR